MVPPVPKPLLAFFPWFCGPAVFAPDVEDEVAEPVFVARPPPSVDVWKTVMVEPPGAVVVSMGVDETIGEDVVGGGVELVGGGLLDEEGVLEEELLIMIEEEEEEVLGGVEEELEGTGGGLLLAIELDGGSEVLEGDDDEEEVVGTPVSVLEVELVDIVNRLLKTSFLGCLGVAMSAKRDSHERAGSTSISFWKRRIIPQA
jgi:hypothetical protein